MWYGFAFNIIVPRGLEIAALFLAIVAVGVACTGDDNSQVKSGDLGKQIYGANCAICHGVNGEGQPNWMVLQEDGCFPAPPHDSTGHTWHHGDGLLFRVVKGGGASLNIPGFKSCMPAFGQTLTDDEIRSVILYLKTLWGPQERSFQDTLSAQDPFP